MFIKPECQNLLIIKNLNTAIILFLKNVRHRFAIVPSETVDERQIR